METSKRKVIVYEYAEIEGKVVVGEGILQEFGCNCDCSSAIVEMPDGSLRNVPVELIIMQDSVVAVDLVDRIRAAFFHMLKTKTGWGRNEIKNLFELAVESAEL